MRVLKGFPIRDRDKWGVSVVGVVYEERLSDGSMLAYHVYRIRCGGQYRKADRRRYYIWYYGSKTNDMLGRMSFSYRERGTKEEVRSFLHRLTAAKGKLLYQPYRQRTRLLKGVCEKDL